MLDQRLAQLPQGLQDDLRKLLDTPPEKRDPVQKYLAEKFEKLLKVEGAELKAADAEYRRTADDTERQIKLLEVKKPPAPKIRALWDRGEPSPTYLLRRGDPGLPGPLLGPGVPAVLTDGKTPFVPKPPFPGSSSTGRRLAFAKWLIAPDNPLTARVMVNRMWAGHFGQGIVKSLGNFPIPCPKWPAHIRFTITRGPFRTGNREIAGEFRAHRNAPEPSGTARLAG